MKLMKGNLCMCVSVVGKTVVLHTFKSSRELVPTYF